jgi:hypothetical protein
VWWKIWKSSLDWETYRLAPTEISTKGKENRESTTYLNGPSYPCFCGNKAFYLGHKLGFSTPAICHEITSLDISVGKKYPFIIFL